MLVADWVAYIFCAFIVTLVMTGELKDVTLCRFATQIAGDRLPPMWRVAILTLAFLRRWVFLAILMATVVFLVIFSGAGAVNVCFSTIAILFMCVLCVVLLLLPFHTAIC